MSAKIAAKMVKAMAAIDAVEKGGRNQKFGYDYVRATDVANEVRKALHEAGVAFTYQVLTERFWDAPTSSGGMQFCCSLHIQGTFTDNESGECLSSSAIGWGADTQDKAPYKAMTGALKYLLRTTFLIPDELDPENESKEREVRAEVEKQKRPILDVPPELDWSYQKSSGVLICRVLDVKVAKTKGAKPKEYVAVKINQQIDGKDMAFYWHESHKAELLAAKGKICKFLTLFTDKGFLNIDMVLEISGKSIIQDEPKSVLGDKPLGDLETQARLLASNMDWQEEELRELFGSQCGGSWAKTLEALQRTQAQIEGSTI